MRVKACRCTCPHTAKHHKQTGRCRKGCKCRAGAIKFARKLSRKVPVPQ